MRNYYSRRTSLSLSPKRNTTGGGCIAKSCAPIAVCTTPYVCTCTVIAYICRPDMSAHMQVNMRARQCSAHILRLRRPANQFNVHSWTRRVFVRTKGHRGSSYRHTYTYTRTNNRRVCVCVRAKEKHYRNIYNMHMNCRTHAHFHRID